MSTLTLDHEPSAVAISVTNDRLIVELADGRSLSVPLDWYPRLLHATRAERDHCRLLGAGYAIQWPDLDEHIGVVGLVAGRRSRESADSFAHWLAARQPQPQ